MFIPKNKLCSGDFMSKTTTIFTLMPWSICLSLALLFIVSCGQNAHTRQQLFAKNTTSPDFAITNVNILSEDGSRMLPNRTVYIQDRKISQITASTQLPESVNIIDGTNQYLIPGLIDSHAHLQDNPNDLIVYAAYGVTAIREMSGNQQHLEWRDEIEQGRLGPKMHVFSEKISSKSGLWGLINSLFWTRINVSSDKQAEALIVRLMAEGYRGAKIASDINKPMYLAVTKAAEKHNFKVAGHIPAAITLNELLTSHHQEIVHIEELVKSFNIEFGHYYSKTADDFLKFVEQRSNELAPQLKQREMSVGTTLWFAESQLKQVLELEAMISSLDLSLTNPQVVAKWQPGNNKFELKQNEKADPELVARVRKYWETFVKANQIVFKSLVNHDVTLLAGTDAMTSLVAPGISMHQELGSLVNAGLSPAQALRAATLAPAQWMNESTGKIAVGFRADLLLLNANPLQNIKNTTEIGSVVLNGNILDKAQISGLLQQIREEYQTQ